MSDETLVRLLFCHVCKSVDEIPDYEGPPEQDDLLAYRVAEHHFPSGDPHRGVLARVKLREWAKDTYKRGILDKMAAEAGLQFPGTGPGMGQAMYDLKDNFAQDAIMCWKAHNRTTDCDDYHAPNKRLYVDSAAERKDAGMPTALRDRPYHYLCDYCPVQSLIDQKKNIAKGLDK